MLSPSKQKRSNRIRYKLKKSNRDSLRLSIYKSSKHLYAQLIDDKKGITIVSANESKENVDKSISDILDSKRPLDNDAVFRDTFTSPLKEAREQFEKEYLTIQLKKNHGNISKTADFIGMERSALHRKLKQLGIKGIN